MAQTPQTSHTPPDTLYSMIDSVLASPATPEYLSNYLMDIRNKRPSIVDRHYLEKIGVDAVKAKAQHVELSNMGLASRLQQRIPQKLSFDEAALILMSHFTFKNIRVSDKTNDYLLGVFVSHGPKKGTYMTQLAELRKLADPLVPYFRTRDIDDVLDKIERIAPIVTQTADPSLFVVNNGIYNQKSKELTPFTPEYVSLVKIPVDYVYNPVNPVIIADDGVPWDVESWINDLADNDIETDELIWQVIADCLQPNFSRGRSIWFYSEKGNNGKGTLGQLIKNILGYGNYSSLSVAEFKHEYLKESLIGVAANIADENAVGTYIDSVQDYKASITGDDININRKYEKPVKLQFKGSNIQMMNGLPKTNDKSDSFYRRLIMVPFIKSFTGNGERTYIKDVYIVRDDVLQYVLWKALDLEFDQYIIPMRSQALLMEYKEMNNPVMQFWNEIKEDLVWDLVPAQFLYDLFVSWSRRNNPNGKPVARQGFTETLSTLLAVDTEWESKMKQSDRVRSTNKMDGDEPLISEYKLTDWQNPTGSTMNDPVKLRSFVRKPTYRGIVRKPKAPSIANNGTP